MKKFIYIILFTLLFIYNCFSFPIENYYWIRTPNDVIKIGNKIGMLFGDTYQIRDINDFILNSDVQRQKVIHINTSQICICPNIFFYK